MPGAPETPRRGGGAGGGGSVAGGGWPACGEEPGRGTPRRGGRGRDVSAGGRGARDLEEGFGPAGAELDLRSSRRVGRVG